MATIRSRLAGGLFLCIAVVGGGGTTGCNHELFVDRDARSDQTIRYYDNDSATETTKERRQAIGMPFGMPQGSAAQ